MKCHRKIIKNKNEKQPNIFLIWAEVTGSGLSHQWVFVLVSGSLRFRLVVSPFWLWCLRSISLLLERRSCWEGGDRSVDRLMEWTWWLVIERTAKVITYEDNPFIAFVTLSCTICYCWLGAQLKRIVIIDSTETHVILPHLDLLEVRNTQMSLNSLFVITWWPQ